MDDLARSVSFLLSNEDLSGVFNITAPNPVTNNVFGKTLAQKLKRPYLIPLPYWQLKLMFGEGAQVLTHSSAILPSRLVDLGFKFNYEDIDSALESIVNNLERR
jgi:NAD dependent epimerase/dehydratase family enzyme